jgi:response regulator of citrate/malate metabolism
VLLDVCLPDVSGLRVLRALRADAGGTGPETDVLVVTAARDVETVRGALRGGAVQYLIKPFDARTLRERLLQYARRRPGPATLAGPGQEDVDRVFGAGTAPAPGAELPEGLTAQTAALVRRAMAECPDGLSASECAVRTGLSRAGTRRYLEHFLAAGPAEVTLRYGTTGRPERRYRGTSPLLGEDSRRAGKSVWRHDGRLTPLRPPSRDRDNTGRPRTAAPNRSFRRQGINQPRSGDS